MDFRLGDEEKILLDTFADEDYKIGFFNRVVVTNQRCVFFKNYGAYSINATTGKSEMIKPDFRMEQEIQLNNIKETYTHYLKGDVCIKFRLMDGQTAIFPLLSEKMTAGAAMFMGSPDMFTNTLLFDMFLFDRLVNYINKLIS